MSTTTTSTPLAAPPAARRVVLSTLSTLLGIDAEVLAAHLRSGADLAELLAHHGVTIEEVAEALDRAR